MERLAKMLKEFDKVFRVLFCTFITFFLLSQVFDYFGLVKWSRAFFFFAWIVAVILIIRGWWLNLVKFKNWLKNGK
jgi:hypothetical protein